MPKKRRYKSKAKKKSGLAPGTPVFVGDVKVEDTSLSILSFSQNNSQFSGVDIESLLNKSLNNKDVHWVNVTGLHKVKEIEQICEKWDISRLIIEDIVNTTHRPKLEIFDEFIFVIAKMYIYNSEQTSMETEQISLVLKDNVVISFQERPGDVFGALRNRIERGKGIVRKKKADYLLYCLLDSIVDSYFGLLEEVDDDLDRFEQNMIVETSTSALEGFFSLKRSLLYLRKSVWPLREMSSQLAKGESQLIHQDTTPYLRDLYEHVIQVVDTVETFRDLANGLTEMYLSIINNRMNEVMKVLTVCASIFIPLTFLVGIYGMNFEYMPELKVKNGYFTLIGIMIFLAISMLLFFKKKKWL